VSARCPTCGCRYPRPGVRTPRLDDVAFDLVEALRFFPGSTAAELAETIGRPVATVRRVLRGASSAVGALPFERLERGPGGWRWRAREARP
jgi:hypothetical protein